MASLIRSFRAATATALPLARAPLVSSAVARGFASSALRKAGGGPPQLLGPGAKAGEVPTE
jgi:cytochrome c oxidase subunit 5b